MRLAVSYGKTVWDVEIKSRQFYRWESGCTVPPVSPPSMLGGESTGSSGVLFNEGMGVASAGAGIE